MSNRESIKDAKSLIEAEKIKKDPNRLIAAKRAAYEMRDADNGVIRKVVNLKVKVEGEKRRTKPKPSFNVFRRI